MKQQLKRMGTVCVAALLAGATSLSMAAPMESVTGLDVHNPRPFIAALEKYFESDDATGNVTIWALDFAGETDVSHLAIGNFDSYADYEQFTNERRTDTTWGAFVGSLRDMLSVESRTMAIERYRQGSGWQQHGAMAAFVMAVSDPAKYAEAFSELVESADNPGSVRLMELRFGGQGATHAALISAPDMTTLNDYLDELFGSKAYRDFADDVGDIREILNVEMLSRVATYEK